MTVNRMKYWSPSGQIHIIRVGTVAQEERHIFYLNPCCCPVERRSVLCIRNVDGIWVLLQLGSLRFEGESKNDPVDQGKVLHFDPVALTTLCDTAECVLLCVIALTAEDKVPHIVIRTMTSISALIYKAGTVIPTFHQQVPPG